jgi:hypothetical protein
MMIKNELCQCILSCTLIVFMGTATAAPTNVKESEFLPGCRSTCENQTQKMGVPFPQRLHKCECYCRNIWQKMTNKDVDFYVKEGAHSRSMLEKQAQAFEMCFAEK